jgi:hypothetical protein
VCCFPSSFDQTFLSLRCLFYFFIQFYLSTHELWFPEKQQSVK